MTQNNLQKNAELKINEIISSLHKYNFQTTDPVKKEYNYEFSVLSGGEKIKVLVYFGKKGLKTIVQGNKTSPLFQEIRDIAEGAITLNFPEEELKEPENYIGSDETGKGDVFGPIITCAVFVDEKIKMRFKEIGVTDSKNLNDGQIVKIAGQIRKTAKDNFEIIGINPKRYNELYDKFKNINEILNWTHTKAIENLLERMPAEVIITDKFRKKDLQFSAKFSFRNYEIIQEPKAEKYSAVAAASILAKERQIKWFADQKKNGLDLKRGSSAEAKENVEKLLQKYDSNKLAEIAKMHFKTIKKLI